MSKTPRTQTESNYTSVFSDVSANLSGRSKIVSVLRTANILINYSSCPWIHQNSVSSSNYLGLFICIYSSLFNINCEVIAQ